VRDFESNRFERWTFPGLAPIVREPSLSARECTRHEPIAPIPRHRRAEMPQPRGRITGRNWTIRPADGIRVGIDLEPA
jgi:hypothetical protein